MTASVVAQGSIAGDGASNEDRVGYLSDDVGVLAWVIDGATPVTASRTTSHPHSDAAWLASTAAAALFGSSVGRPLDQTLAAVVEEVIRQYEIESRQTTWDTALEVPQAALTVVRIEHSGRIESAHLGDCSVFSLTTTGLARKVFHRQPRLEMRLNERSLTEQQRVAARLNEHRHAAIRSGLSGVLIPQRGLTLRAEYRSFRLGPGFVVLMTDGVARLFTTYGWRRAGVLRRCTTATGVQSVFGALREYENRVDHRLYKRRDDASLVCAQVT